MIKISRISSPLKDKIKNIDLCSQLDGDGSFEGNYKTLDLDIIKVICKASNLIKTKNFLKFKILHLIKK